MLNYLRRLVLTSQLKQRAILTLTDLSVCSAVGRLTGAFTVRPPRAPSSFPIITNKLTWCFSLFICYRISQQSDPGHRALQDVSVRRACVQLSASTADLRTCIGASSGAPQTQSAASLLSGAPVWREQTWPLLLPPTMVGAQLDPHHADQHSTVNPLHDANHRATDQVFRDT